MDLFRAGQRHWNRPSTFRENLRHVSTSARPRRIFRNRNRLDGVQEDRRTPWRPDVGGVESRKRLGLLRCAGGSGEMTVAVRNIVAPIEILLVEDSPGDA